MRKFFKWFFIVTGSLVVIAAIGFQVMKSQTKKYSPEETVIYSNAELNLEVFYNRPSKKERVIFGGLVPYGQVWRTGANEATTFSSSTDITVAGKTLPAGKYTLWTIPDKSKWTVIFNSEQYGWGVDFNEMASRNPASDAVQVEVPALKSSNVYEQFTITFEESPLRMRFVWDNTVVDVPIE